MPSLAFQFTVYMFQISYHQSDKGHRKHCLCCLEATPIIMITYCNETISSRIGYFCHCEQCYWLFQMKADIIVLCSFVSYGKSEITFSIYILPIKNYEKRINNLSFLFVTY